MPNLSASEIKEAIERLREPRVKYKVNLASSPEVARQIVDSLPGVKELKESGPEAAQAVLHLLQDEVTLQDANLTSIGLRILNSHPSESVKLTLAKLISQRRFRGFNSQFAAETFLNSAGIEPMEGGAINTAVREAERIQAEINAQNEED